MLDFRTANIGIELFNLNADAMKFDVSFIMINEVLAILEWC